MLRNFFRDLYNSKTCNNNNNNNNDSNNNDNKNDLSTVFLHDSSTSIILAKN